MLHVGNDIVDLDTRGTIGRAKDLRFVERILTPDEKKVLLGCKENPDKLLWSFWAAKEAAFKAVSKTYPDISSAPRRYPVTLSSQSLKSKFFGHVGTPAGSVAINIFIENNYVHCIGTTGSLEDLKRVFYDMERIDSESGTQLSPDQQSFLVRKLAKEKIAQHLNLDKDNIDILRNRQKKRPGPPVICFNNRTSGGMDISLSHHGQYVAFATLDEKKE